MTEREFMRIFESFEGEISMSDFTPEELEEAAFLYETDMEKFKRRYFDFYDDIKSHTLRGKKQDW